MPPFAARHIRKWLGAFWLLDAGLQAQPHFFSSDWWHNDLAQSVMGQPQPISASILWITGHLADHAAAVNSFAIVVQATIGICLLVGRFERAAIIASIPWALAVWWVGEGLGALLTGFAVLPAGAPGPVLLYPLIGLLAWPHPDQPAGRPIATPAAIAAWAAIWVGGAFLDLPWRFPAARMLQANIEQNSLGQPRWLTEISHTVYHTVGAHPLLVPGVIFVLQLAIGTAALFRATRVWALAGGAILAIISWVAVQDLGGLAAGASTDPGQGPVLVLLAFAVASAGPSVRLRRWPQTSGNRPDRSPVRVRSRPITAGLGIQSVFGTE